MKIQQSCFRYFRSFLVVLLIVQMSACGTLLYPERQGQQRAAKIDVGVVILDSVGLLFFILPGILAFAVDFATGAIYLPPGQSKTRLFTENGIPVIHIDLKDLNTENIEAVVARHTGHRISLSNPDIEISKLKDKRELIHQFDTWVLNNAIVQHVSR